MKRFLVAFLVVVLLSRDAFAGYRPFYKIRARLQNRPVVSVCVSYPPLRISGQVAPSNRPVMYRPRYAMPVVNHSMPVRETGPGVIGTKPVTMPLRPVGQFPALGGCPGGVCPR